jgi:hypothetical protein
VVIGLGHHGLDALSLGGQEPVHGQPQLVA